MIFSCWRHNGTQQFPKQFFTTFKIGFLRNSHFDAVFSREAALKLRLRLPRRPNKVTKSLLDEENTIAVEVNSDRQGNVLTLGFLFFFFYLRDPSLRLGRKDVSLKAATCVASAGESHTHTHTHTHRFVEHYKSTFTYVEFTEYSVQYSLFNTCGHLATTKFKFRTGIVTRMAQRGWLDDLFMRDIWK